ncbi:MAG: A/G-specific adenine glycosylase [Candidatus Pacebacteria bacterium]|nr:A/G-specific adenine glycosylase [Candidatus Paceibacterota bacterium]
MKNNKDAIFIKKVISFYNRNGRHTLAWRKNITAYKILVSEIMLQQTQVSRVVPKFDMWMNLYPTLASLREATLTDILILWQGLGYQRRAKALHDIAKEYKIIPKDFESLCKLPSVGTYTASAVCAFAYDAFSYPMIETNIRTALIETFHKDKKEINDDILREDLKRIVQNVLIQNMGARKWYYALMDYGAYLKEIKISHNDKSAHYSNQKVYKGSDRELRAKILFAITHKEKIPVDNRTQKILVTLSKEGYIKKVGTTFSIKE